MRKVISFTLIELLIVVAIIAILAAIAVPNFLEAQARSKVSRIKADMRTVGTAIETYRVDYNLPPITGTYHPGMSWDDYVALWGRDEREFLRRKDSLGNEVGPGYLLAA